MSRLSAVDSRATCSVAEVVLRDLTSEGIAVETRQPLRVGGTYAFRIHEGDESVALDGVVKWCKLQRMIDLGSGESQALYRAGIRFRRIATDFPSQVEPDSSRSAVNPEPLELLALEDRKGRQASLAVLVKTFIKDFDSDSI